MVNRIVQAILALFVMLLYIRHMPKLKLSLVQIRVTDEEKDLLKQLADKNNMSVSVYLRFLIHRESSR
jgi:hypothetical protein